MGNVKKEVEELIKKRAKKINELRTNSTKKMSHENIVYKFFKDMEDIYQKAMDQYDYSALMDFACHNMNQRMHALDHGCSMRVVVNDAEDWKELRVTGVEITWSQEWIDNNPEKEKTTFVDVTHMFMDSLPED
jgi:hypothetical protein